MKKILIGGFIFCVFAVTVKAQTGSTTQWEPGEREIFLNLTVFVRPQISEMGTVRGFFYDIDRGYTIEPPVKTARGRYSIHCIIGSEFTDDRIFLTINFVRTSEIGALIDSILVQNSTRPGQQMITSTIAENMFIMMQFFAFY